MADGTALVDRERFEASLRAATDALDRNTGRALWDLFHPGSLDRPIGPALETAMAEITGAWADLELTGASDNSRFHVVSLPASFVDRHGDWTVVLAVRPFRARHVHAIMARATEPPNK